MKNSIILVQAVVVMASSLLLVVVVSILTTNGSFFFHCKVSGAAADNNNDETTTPNETTFIKYDPPYYYNEQLIDHTGEGLYYNKSNIYYTQRYYQSDKYYYSSNSNYNTNTNTNTNTNRRTSRSSSISEKPIFVILGGEGSIEPTTGLFYPFIYETLAKRYNAYVIEPEHRFYGTSQPISRNEIDSAHQRNLPDPRIGLLTYEQAIYDMVRLVHSITSTQLGCNVGQYTDLPPCGPVIAVGGSYPGFLSAMTRILVPDVIDIAYAASAPIQFYSQQVHPNDYYTHITNVAEYAVTGCSNAVASTLQDIYTYYSKQSIDIINSTTAIEIGICPTTIPTYAIQTKSTLLFLQELQMMIAYSFANANMAYYPPSNQTKLVQSCSIFLNTTLQPTEKVSQFLLFMLGISSTNNNNGTIVPCYNMTEQVPAGASGTISAGDWSGVGSGRDGDSWDYQTCTQLIEPISLTGMIQPVRTFSYDWLQNYHCPQRFYNTTTDPQYNNNLYHLNTLFNTTTTTTNTSTNNNNISYILFTNGLQDGWSVGGIQYNVSDTVLAINLPNGAHHSDLSRTGPNPNTDTPDLTDGYQQIISILDHWINEIIHNKRFKKKEIQQHHHQSNNTVTIL